MTIRVIAAAVSGCLLCLACFGQEKERALGEQSAAAMRRDAGTLENAAVCKFVERVGARLTAQVAEAPGRFTFEVVMAPDAMEPIPLPGGFVMIPARFFLAVADEAEFAGMLAHAISHVILQHGWGSAGLRIFRQFRSSLRDRCIQMPPLREVWFLCGCGL